MAFRPMRTVAAGVLLLFFPHAGWAQERAVLEAGGYAKYMFGYAEPARGGGYADHLVHARLNTTWHPGDALTGTMEMRFRAFAGGTVRQTPDFAATLRNESLAGNLDGVFWNTPGSVGFGEIDRLSIAWSPPGAQVSLGRQRIAWGTNLVWNPIDVFNPRSVLDFDYEERPAVDAVRVQWYTGELAKVEGVVKGGRTPDEVVAAGMWSFNVHQYDIRFLGGHRREGWIAGGAWAGDILGGGFRGELLASQEGDRGNVWSLSGAVSGDYTFSSSLYLHTEFLYNNRGVKSGAGSARLTSLRSGMLSPARFSLYQEVSLDVTPLIRASGFVIFNPDDHSSVLVPSVSWNVLENVDVMGLLILAAGADGTEYGEYGRYFFLRFRYSF
jgi:hypothetical protein